jgi:hypothetical protein
MDDTQISNPTMLMNVSLYVMYPLGTYYYVRVHVFGLKLPLKGLFLAHLLPNVKG